MVAASTLRRFGSIKPKGSHVVLSALNLAYRSGRSIFTSRVFDPDEVGRVLKDGHQSRKIGRFVTKGKRAGWPIFTLTLEERATCPRDCKAWGFCFAPDTMVLKSDLSWARIDHLCEGDEIVGFDEEAEAGKDRLYRHATVDAIREVTKPRIEVRTSRGVIVVTGDHLFLARRKQSTTEGRKGWQWLRSDSLGASDQILFLAEPWAQDRSYDAARVRGFVEGEGCVCLNSENGFRKTRLAWAQRPGKLLEEINDAVARMGFRFQPKNLIGGVNRTLVTQVQLSGGWREVLRFLGTVRPTRLLENAAGLVIGHSVTGRGSVCADVFGTWPVDDGPVFEIATSSRTLVANGFLAHNCYGNNMQAAERIVAGPELEAALWSELEKLQADHPGGFMVRLHVLGDFYNLGYVGLWDRALEAFPALHVFGFTAHDPESEIGAPLLRLAQSQWERFAVRFSGHDGPELGSQLQPDAHPEAIPCPAQTGATDCCATCALCWHSRRSISFARH